MRTKKIRKIEEGGSYDLSISDMMAALCCVFALAFVGFAIPLVQKSGKADEYGKKQHELVVDLKKTFPKEKLDKWGAVIDEKKMSIRFYNPSIQFEPYYSDKDNYIEATTVKKEYREILNEFFPALVAMLKDDKYKYIDDDGELKDFIEEVRIEGHSTEAESMKNTAAGQRKDYEEGIHISQGRSQNVLEYCIKNTKYDAKEDWVRKHISASGYSNSHPVEDKNGKPIMEQSRRVEFRIKTNADDVVNDLQRNFKKD